MKILITGYKGFIGQNFVNKLKDKHEISLFEWLDSPPDFEGLDWVIHLGAISSTTETNVEKVMMQNFDFTTWLLKKCVKHKVNLQYASSASVYGLGINFNESAPKDPRTPYAWSKYLFDRLEPQWIDEDIRIQGFRYFNVHGPHEEHKGNQASPYYQFMKQAEAGQIKVFEGSKDFKRDFIHVDDVFDIQMKFLDIKENGIWNVGSGKPKSFYEVAQLYNVSIVEIPMPENLKNSYQSYTCADLTKLNRSLGL